MWGLQVAENIVWRADRVEQWERLFIRMVSFKKLLVGRMQLLNEEEWSEEGEREYVLEDGRLFRTERILDSLRRLLNHSSDVEYLRSV